MITVDLGPLLKPLVCLSEVFIVLRIWDAYYDTKEIIEVYSERIYAEQHIFTQPEDAHGYYEIVEKELKCGPL